MKFIYIVTQRITTAGDMFRRTQTSSG